MVKAYINNDQTATFVCPQCQKPLIKDVSKYIARNTETKLKVKCGCGHQYAASLEKRKKFRKETNLDGIYKYTLKDPENKIVEGVGKMTVTNISFSGLTIVRKEVLVQNIHGRSVGMEFIFNQTYDSVLGFYLLSNS